MVIRYIKSPTYGRKRILLDDQDIYLYEQYVWRLSKRAHTFYVVAHTWKKDKSTTIRLHNLILGERFVDHIDGNGLNNCRANLRAANHLLNARNRKNLRLSKTSQYKGVFFWKQSKLRHPWVAKITLDNKVHYLGFYASEKEAARAYNQAAAKHFGSFANLNRLGA